ncbi:50S ribosomal protein L20 [Mucisphaera sp.]|uniref:50S ribosomal protein L20 n=1 Tax=Mucisphaera sp. TaxID=2913024 RepID=UPI003D0E97E9
MPRAVKGAARRQSKVRWFKKTKGNRGARRNQWGRIKETVYRAGAYAYEHRRLVKRDYRQLWILRINAACQTRGINYSRFAHGLKLANIVLNRKMLSEIAIADPQSFDLIVEKAKAALEADSKQAA